MEVTNMARRFKPVSDNAYNARRRYYRSAQRNLEKAESSSGASAARYRALARQDLEDALKTYDADAPKQKISKPIRELAGKFGIDLEGQRGEFIASTFRQRQHAVRESFGVLEGSLQDEEIRRQREARALFANSKIGRRVIGGLVDVWREAATDDDTGMVDKSLILPALFDYFEVDNLADMIEKVEKMIGSALYADEDSDAVYEAVKILIQIKTADNTYTV